MNLDNLLHSLARFMISRAASLAPPVVIPYGGASSQLYRWEASEPDADPNLYSVLALDAGPCASDKPTQSLHVRTVATSNKAAITRAQLLLETFLQPDGSPIRLQTIEAFAADDTPEGHYLLANATLTQRPALVARDPRGRPQALFKLTADLYPQP